MLARFNGKFFAIKISNEISAGGSIDHPFFVVLVRRNPCARHRSAVTAASSVPTNSDESKSFIWHQNFVRRRTRKEFGLLTLVNKLDTGELKFMI